MCWQRRSSIAGITPRWKRAVTPTLPGRFQSGICCLERSGCHKTGCPTTMARTNPPFRPKLPDSWPTHFGNSVRFSRLDLQFFHELTSRFGIGRRFCSVWFFSAPRYTMSFSSLRRRARASFKLRSLAIGILLWPVAAAAGPMADTIAVNVDQAKLVKLPTRVSTIVVGNPLIADVTLQTGGILVVTGKGYGATNFIAMDRTGEVLVDRVIQVEGPTDQLVTIYRGVERESYSCMPVCQRRITLGDGENYFKATMDQAGSLNSQASGSAAAAGRTN